MEDILENNKKYSDDVHHLSINGKEFFIIGTAHISQNSADLVRDVISNEKPDVVCVELDSQRYKALAEKKKWEELDLKQLIKQKQLSTLLINILLASYQKKLGEKLGVKPGVELLEATKVAETHKGKPHKGKDHDKDGDVDSKDYMKSKDIAIKKAMKK